MILKCSAGDDNYKGTWLHHLIMDQNISNYNLVYAIAIVLASGGDFYITKDSNGITPYALLTRARYPGQGCLGLQIYRDITEAVEDLRSSKAEEMNRFQTG